MQFKGHTWPSISIFHKMAIRTCECKQPRFCVHFSRQNKDKQACSSRQPACAHLGSRTLGLGRFPPTLPKPPPGCNCSIVSLTPVTRLAHSWPTSQSPAPFFAFPPVDLNSCCSTNSWETQGVTTKVNHCRDNSGLVFSQPVTTDNVQKQPFSWPKASPSGLSCFKIF